MSRNKTEIFLISPMLFFGHQKGAASQNHLSAIRKGV